MAGFLTILAAALLLTSATGDEPKKKPKQKEQVTDTKGQGRSVLWRYPVDIAARNLYYGPGGKKDEPAGTFTFQKEDLGGSSPKFDCGGSTRCKVAGQDGRRSGPRNCRIASGLGGGLFHK